jgi:hypothetical protein
MDLYEGELTKKALFAWVGDDVCHDCFISFRDLYGFGAPLD